MTDRITKHLSEHMIFKGLPFTTISDLIGCASEKSFSKGETIFLEGEEANYCHILLTGAVDLSIHTHNRGPIIIQSLQAKEVLGWSWLFSPFIWQFDAVAKKDTKSIRLDGKCIRKKCDENPELGYELMRRFSRILQNRLIATRLQLVDIYGKSN
ncbi:MAG: cyclic nucleotide-binding domain-containing protein [Candidatus Marinimicrobia bacterium]|jgi:CRP-like cAMP-binding protein|nr:cyclic nucleotide-binding domain-containing protein [Candidatus Neomarinimicrobiota bacterium]MBT4068845.1 cyclic nucleotide-binding domain-containing protein [Candidatus Neomarinimicrobiota bacterium]MBT4271275.1 cyclic nucleotide-binding domain-containing protein [Candidatus Neomarinimicrobiota bacterium]MBT4371458.1 cyclic nucleotide-binding domain-containing protein [Candidatus Neomarinimicrobiota bacterium]MBT4809943.1 cyclic nucleotide-binding domain-containing protein [Candidatus Neom